MFCNQCGGEVPNGVGYCPNCGAPVEQPQYQQPDPQYQQPQYSQPDPYQQPQYQQPVYAQPMAPVGDPQERSLATSNLVFGILALAFNCFYYTSFLSIIFGAISMSKSKQYASMYPLTGKAKLGSIFGKIGFIIGIVLTILVFITVVACICSASSNYYY